MNGDPEPRRRGYHHGNLRVALVEAAMALIATQGVQALTLRALARRVGVTHSAPYRHFRDKAALLRAVAEQGLSELATALSATGSVDAPASAEPGHTEPRAAGPGPRVPSVLHALSRCYVRFAVERMPLFRLMFAPEIGGGPAQALVQARAAVLAALERPIHAEQAAGRLRQVQTRALALSWWAQLHGLAVLLVDQQLPDAGAAPGQVADALVDQALEVLLQGAAAHPVR